jgi:hypothetical protein
MEAEAVSLLCCESLGLPGAEYSRGYIQSWGQGQTFTERSAQRKAIEVHDLAGAVNMYVRAIEAIREYAFISCEKGFIGQLVDEQDEELGRGGEVQALERLTMCLIRLGRADEAAQHARDYFSVYRGDQQSAAFHRITKRIQKAMAQKR